MTALSLILVATCLLISNTWALLSPTRVPSITSRKATSLQAGPFKIDEALQEAKPKSFQGRKQQQQNDLSHKIGDLWEIRVYNDEINTHEWVARCLVVVAGATEWEAYQTTKIAHREGEAFLGLYEKEVAEFYTAGLSQQGITARMFPVGDFQ